MSAADPREPELVKCRDMGSASTKTLAFVRARAFVRFLVESTGKILRCILQGGPRGSEQSLRFLSVDLRPQFAQLNDSEQVFFVLLARLHNEVSILSKAVLATNQGIDQLHGPVLTAQRAQGLFYLRELTGKLCEGWQLVHDLYYGSMVSKRYDGDLSAEAKSACKSIKRYFGRSGNPVEFIRNKHAFHYDADAISQELKTLPSTEPLPAFVSAEGGNTLFVFAEDIATCSVLQRFDPDQRIAMRKLTEETIKVAGWFQDFGGEVLTAMLKHHGTPDSDEKEVKDVPVLGEVWLPFFMRRDP